MRPIKTLLIYPSQIANTADPNYCFLTARFVHISDSIISEIFSERDVAQPCGAPTFNFRLTRKSLGLFGYMSREVGERDGRIRISGQFVLRRSATPNPTGGKERQRLGNTR